MVMASFLRVFSASSGATLLLLATTTTTTVMLQLVDGATTASSATTSTTTSEESDVPRLCGNEYTACSANDTCTACLNAIDEYETEIDECGGTLDFTSLATSSWAACDEFDAFACCVDEVSDEECLGDDNFVQYWLCIEAANGCGVLEISCEGLNSGATTATPATFGIASTAAAAAAVGLSCAFMSMLQLL